MTDRQISSRRRLALDVVETLAVVIPVAVALGIANGFAFSRNEWLYLAAGLVGAILIKLALRKLPSR